MRWARVGISRAGLGGEEVEEVSRGLDLGSDWAEGESDWRTRRFVSEVVCRRSSVALLIDISSAQWVSGGEGRIPISDESLAHS